MFAGHFGLAAIVKAKQPETPLWALMLSTQLLDVAFVPLFVSGIETIDSTGGNGYGEGLIHADYTHSLIGAFLIALLAGLLAKRLWSRRSGFTIGAVVFSHWLLDLLVHHADMPVLPGNFGNLPLLGFGLWGFPSISAGLEAVLIMAGTFLYIRSVLTRAKTTESSYANINYKSRAIVAGGVMGILLAASLITDLLHIG